MRASTLGHTVSCHFKLRYGRYRRPIHDSQVNLDQVLACWCTLYDSRVHTRRCSFNSAKKSLAKSNQTLLTRVVQDLEAASRRAACWVQRRIHVAVTAPAAILQEQGFAARTARPHCRAVYQYSQYAFLVESIIYAQSHLQTDTLAPDTDHDVSSGLSPASSVGERENESSLNTTLTNNHRVPFYRRRATNKSETALSSSTAKSPRRRGKPSFLSRVVQRVVPCVPDGPSPMSDSDQLQLDEHHSLDAPNLTVPTVLILPPIISEPPSRPSEDSQVIVPPPPATQLLPPDETDGVTSGAVQPPGSTGEPIARIPTRDTDDSDATSYMDDEADDMHVFDEQAEEERLIKNGGAGIPIGPVSHILVFSGNQILNSLGWNCETSLATLGAATRRSQVPRA